MDFNGLKLEAKLNSLFYEWPFHSNENVTEFTESFELPGRGWESKWSPLEKTAFPTAEPSL